MAKIWLAHPRPLYWQQFEDLTHQVLMNVFGDPTAAKHGRAGQTQNGIDVHCRVGGTGDVIAVQCKRRDVSKMNGEYEFGHSLTQQDILEEVAKAEKSALPIRQFIVATTAPADAKIQAWTEARNEERLQRRGSFRISVWHWQDFDGFLNSNGVIQRWYCDLVSHAGDQRTAEVHLLSLVRDAFSRAAFRDPLNVENPRNFRLALAHTQRAVDLGELLDRETGVIIRKAIGGLKVIEQFQIAKKLRTKLIRTLTSLGNTYDVAKTQPVNGGRKQRVMKLDDSGPFLAINDPEIGRELDGLRSEAITLVNRMVGEAGLDPVDSPLI